jgi:molecular chaperone GrpE
MSSGEEYRRLPRHASTKDPEFPNPPSSGPQAGASIGEAAPIAGAMLRSELAADFANFKRRTRQETEDRVLAQKESFIHESLPALDNLERALASGASPDSRQFHQGVEMTMQQLRQHGIETQEGAGQPFDPHLHEAVSQRYDPAYPDHAILDVLQRGYQRGEKVFRPAKVVVNKPPAS